MRPITAAAPTVPPRPIPCRPMKTVSAQAAARNSRTAVLLTPRNPARARTAPAIPYAPGAHRVIAPIRAVHRKDSAAPTPRIRQIPGALRRAMPIVHLTQALEIIPPIGPLLLTTLAGLIMVAGPTLLRLTTATAAIPRPVPITPRRVLLRLPTTRPRTTLLRIARVAAVLRTVAVGEVSTVAVVAAVTEEEAAITS